MTEENYVRLIAGSLVLISLVLAVWLSKWWLILAGLVAIGLIQAAFTNFCPCRWFIHKFDLKCSDSK